ncbi:MAG: type II toxin-antitoxin system VapC family toxin [Myxococcales bacterium]
MTRLFLDTNVFLYAIGGEGPHREPCRAVLAAVGRGELKGVTNSEVLQEILHVRARRISMKDATQAARSAAGIVAEVLPVTADDMLDACSLLDSHPNLNVRDALHVAVMQNSRIGLLVSVDRDFDSLKTLRRLDPTDALDLLPKGA